MNTEQTQTALAFQMPFFFVLAFAFFAGSAHGESVQPAFFAKTELALFSATPGQTRVPMTAEGPQTSDEDREKFAKELSGDHGTFSVTGSDHRTLQANVEAGADAVALLSNRLDVLFWQKGFTTLHIILPDGDGGQDEWVNTLGPTGYVTMRSTLYCSKTGARHSGELCSAPGVPVPASPPVGTTPPRSTAQSDGPVPSTPEAREQVAQALTANATKQGRKTTFTVCGKNGAKDSLCIDDPEAPGDGYVNKTAANNQLAGMLYQVGFRYLFISNGKGGFWGSEVQADKFVPYHESSAVPGSGSNLDTSSSDELNNESQLANGPEAVLNEEHEQAVQLGRRAAAQLHADQLAKPVKNPSNVQRAYEDDLDSTVLITKLAFGMTKAQVIKKIGHEHEMLQEDAVALRRSYWSCEPMRIKGRYVAQAEACMANDMALQLGFYRGALYVFISRCGFETTCNSLRELFTKKYGEGVPYVEPIDPAGGWQATGWRQGSRHFSLISTEEVQCVDTALMPPSLRSSVIY